MKECYVKCASNEQAQALRPYLVQMGFVDNVEWNDYAKTQDRDAICIRNGVEFKIYNEDTASDMGEPLLYTVPADADLAEAAKTIKTLFDKL